MVSTSSHHQVHRLQETLISFLVWWNINKLSNNFFLLIYCVNCDNIMVNEIKNLKKSPDIPSEFEINMEVNHC